MNPVGDHTVVVNRIHLVLFELCYWCRICFDWSEEGSREMDNDSFGILYLRKYNFAKSKFSEIEWPITDQNQWPVIIVVISSRNIDTNCI